MAATMTANDSPPLTVPLRLMTPRADASRDIQNQVKIGQAIRNQRVRDQRDLDEARREKQEWVQRTSDLLAHLFNLTTVADKFNDWVATILPEYAEFGMFVDLFDDEMRHRLGRLHAILKGLKEIPEPPPIGAQEPGFSEAKITASPAPVSSATAPETTLGTFLDEINPPVADKEPTPMSTLTPTPLSSPTPTPAPPSPATAPVRSAMQPMPSMQSSVTSGTLIVRVADDPARDAIAGFLQRLGLKLLLADRTAATAKPLFEDLNAQSSSTFALILTAPPDQQHSGSNDADFLFDLGCCVGRLGPSRVIVMHRNSEPHVDRFGLTHVAIDASEGWQLQLAKHLRRAGVDVDLNKLV